jgi:hypothetical protein
MAASWLQWITNLFLATNHTNDVQSATTMAATWPQWMTNSILTANHANDVDNDENLYKGVYTTLLFHFFPPSGPFAIDIRFSTPQTPLTLTIELYEHPVQYPVLSIQIRPPSSFHLNSKRKQANDQMCDHCRELSANLITPRLHAISMFGPHILFYEYTATTNAITLPMIVADPVLSNDTAWWSYDVLEAGGLERIHQVVKDVWAMCEGLSTIAPPPLILWCPSPVDRFDSSAIGCVMA